MASTDSRGRASRSASRRAPGEVTVRSMARQERAFALARQSAFEFEAGAGGRVDGHDLGAHRPARRTQERRTARLGGLDVRRDQAERHHLGGGEVAEPVEGSHPVEPPHPIRAGSRFG